MITKESFKILDGLRGLAALAVAIAHARELLFIGIQSQVGGTVISNKNVFSQIGYALLSLTSLGTGFVITFFILSGFSIAYSINRKPQYFSYLLRRVIRIYPAYILAVMWAVGCFYLVMTSHDIVSSPYHLPQKIVADSVSGFGTPIRIIQNLFYQGIGFINGQFWSLIYEVLFYIAAPLFLIFSFRLYSVFSVILFVSQFFIPQSFVTEFGVVGSFLLNYNFYFFIGILLYKKPQLLEKKYLKRPLSVVVLLVFLFGCSFLVKNYFVLSNKQIIIELIEALYSVVIIKYTLIYAFRIRFLEWLGQFSYTLYLTHIASLFLFYYLFTMVLPQNIFLNFPLTWLLGLCFSVLLAFCLYFAAEKPSKRYLDYLRKQ